MMGARMAEPPRRVPARTAVVRSAGADIWYDVHGEGPTVLCVQGVGVAGTGWQPQVAGLADRWRLVTFDHRGVGRSSAGPPPLTIEAMVEDGLTILEAESVDRVHLMGHSMGGLIALETAARLGPRVASLTPTRPSLPMLVHGLRSRVGTRAMRRDGMLRMILPPDILRGVDRARLAAEMGALFGRDLADQPPIVDAQLRAMSRFSAVRRMDEIRGVPTLVVSGRHDPIAPPRLGRALAAGIAGARFLECPEASHALPIQCAETLNRRLREHLGQAS